ncbi:transferase [Campylobacter coli]|nr:transferase [Campylobacter jejuni]EAL7663086.1 transferase [Campylobacter coli]ECK8468135.1 transferase [Campylobacter jejuni]EGA8626021.1 transferase [Campylobacter coli]ELT5467127.1 transferase [Campylobacter coli]
MKNVIIIGAGGFTRELYSYLKDANYEIIGYIDIQENNFFDLKYLGNEDNFDKKLIQKASFALGVGQINLRKKILVKLSKKSCNFITFIHPQSFVSKEAKIGQGVIVCPFVTINANSNIGDFVLCNIYSSIAHDCKVGEGSILSPYATLNGNSSIGKNCFLATRVSLLPCVNLEDNCIVSADSIISKTTHPINLFFIKI